MNYIKARGPLKDTNNITNHFSLPLPHKSSLQTYVQLHLNINRDYHTIAVVKGSEDYTTIAQSFRDVFQEINEVQENGFVKVGENQISVELFLSGDYKVSKYYFWRCINMGLTVACLGPI